MDKCKISIDLTEKNRTVLESIKQNQKIPYGNTVNLLIQTFANLPSSVKEHLSNNCKDMIREILLQIDSAEGFLLRDMSLELDAYMNIVKYFNDGEYVSIDQIQKAPVIKEVCLSDGDVLYYPSDFILLNPEDAENCTDAFVIEVSCPESFVKQYLNGEYPPHFVYLYQECYEEDIDDLFEDAGELCVTHWPLFQKILKYRVKVNPATRNYDRTELKNFPRVGLFKVDDDNEKQPYGINIRRKKREE